MADQFELQREAVHLVFDKRKTCAIAATEMGVTTEKIVELIYEILKYENLKKQYGNVDPLYKQIINRFFDAIDELYEYKENYEKLTKEIKSLKLSLSILGKDNYNQYIDSYSLMQTE